jgi:hypothetical protein
MKEHPILFSAPMVQAILAGRKTQTRRIVKKNPPFQNDGGEFEWYPGGRRAGFHASMGTNTRYEVPNGWAASWCPYGRDGDRLWVKETFARERRMIFYRADHTMVSGDWKNLRPELLAEMEKLDPTVVEMTKCRPIDQPPAKWRPSIFMPHWASRITLEISAVRVERLQDISDEDAVAEGMQTYQDNPNMHFPHEQFMCLWMSINGEKSWDENPWVWVLEFKRV